MATHSSVLAWRIPGTQEPGGLPSVGLHRVGHDWSNLAAANHSELLQMGWMEKPCSKSFIEKRKRRNFSVQLLPDSHFHCSPCERWKVESEISQSCPTFCNPMDCSLPGFSIHGIFQARVLEWVAISFSKGSSPPRVWTRVSHIAGRHLTLWATREAHCPPHSKLIPPCFQVGWTGTFKGYMVSHYSLWYIIQVQSNESHKFWTYHWWT